MRLTAEDGCLGHQRGRYAASVAQRGRYAAGVVLEEPLRGIRYHQIPEKGRFSSVGETASTPSERRRKRSFFGDPYAVIYLLV